MHTSLCLLRHASLRYKSFLMACAIGVFAVLPAVVHAAANDKIFYLDQAWSTEDRQFYYQVSQGSSVMEYDIFLNLETADSQELFRSDTTSERFGLITQPANPQNNPDGLPIGLAKTEFTEGRWKGKQIGLTCAACHETQLNYKGTHIRVDGGVGNMFDMVGYVKALGGALNATLNDSAKFDRLAAHLAATSADAKMSLRKRLESDFARVDYYNTVVLVGVTESGPSRMDALSAIVNRLTAVQTGIHENINQPLAPSKPPFVWNAPHGSWTQWRGTTQDPIQRNFTEVLGVFMTFDLTSKTPAEGLFDSAATIKNLEKIEDQLARLAPPQWPEDVLGKIDRAKALQGKALFESNCASCHNSWPYTWTAANKYGKRFINVGMVPGKYVGTDPMQFKDAREFAYTKQLADYMPGEFKGKPVVPNGVLIFGSKDMILARAEKALNLSDAETVALHGYREFPLPPQPEGFYKAAPRDGVWATPPFLHNGSVPNLYEMLIPAKERTKKFYVGREFDPIKVGLDTSSKTGKFLFDTTLLGNSNAGHSFQDGPRGNGTIGPLLTDAQRWALVEYLKSIPEQAGRVTPFGGPPDAKEGHGPWTQ
jgi:hypothetical protein